MPGEHFFSSCGAAGARLQPTRQYCRSLAGEVDSDDALSGSSLFDSDEEQPSPLSQQQGREGGIDQTPVRESSDSSGSSSSSSDSSPSRRVRQRHGDADHGAVAHEHMSMRLKATVRAVSWKTSDYFLFCISFKVVALFAALLRVYVVISHDLLLSAEQASHIQTQPRSSALWPPQLYDSERHLVQHLLFAHVFALHTHAHSVLTSSFKMFLYL